MSLLALISFGNAGAEPVALVADRVIDGISESARRGATMLKATRNPLEDMSALERVGFVMIGGDTVKSPHGGSEALAGIIAQPSR